ncbi:MAG: prepilin-type N-terminal cleavage/methylation domain-containing protein [Elusimicrobiaceae bacterium]|nr:prepilin-type N-terminal cleavage/methylation domain-containing protein [Elusimicrobiaceae bacterium]
MKGFTLIELLVVVLIIGILSSVALPQYTKAVEKSRAAEARTMLKSLYDAEMIRNMEMGTEGVGYPLDELSISVSGVNGTAAAFPFSTKNFEYTLESRDGRFSIIAWSLRPRDSVKYYNLGIGYPNNRIQCSGGTGCIQLGFPHEVSESVCNIGLSTSQCYTD